MPRTIPARAPISIRSPTSSGRDGQTAANDQAVGATQPAEQGHHALGLAQRQSRLKHKAGMPARRRELETFVLPVGQLVQE